MSRYFLRFVVEPHFFGRVVLAMTLAVMAGGLRAQPSGGQVVAGTAVFSEGPGALTVTQSSARAIINWQDFSLASGELARFVQPDATSATLNRVISGLPSTLSGTIEANGSIFLINPNGILIGATARIDAGGFLGSTLDVTNQEFLSGGELHFKGGSSAAVQNLGAINALGGDVFLIARRVENSGTIAAAKSAVGLAAGSEILLTTGGDQRLFVQASSMPGGVANAGMIAATTAELKAAGGNAYALAIANSGVVRATGSDVRGGQIWLVAQGESSVIHSGELDGSSRAGPGGTVVVTGGRVQLARESRVDASGADGGGRIRIDGGWQPGDWLMVNGVLDASATSSGDGGFVETSAGRVEVGDDARVSTRALHGRSGTWLIDPVDFTIAASGGDMTGAAVDTALAGGNFTIQSSSGSTGTAGDVNVNDTIAWSANKLTLNAHNNINITVALNASGTGSLALEYGQGAVAAGNASTYLVRAPITLPAGNNFSTKLGSDGVATNYTVITSLGAEDSTTATDLQGMSGNLAGAYALGANIDATATSGWNAGAGFAPVGVSAARFTGKFDGLGHAVSGLTISRATQNDVGLFGYVGVGGVVKNINVSGGTITGQTGVGALAGNNSGNVSYATASAAVSGRNNVGGLVGASLGPIANVSATGNVSNTAGGTGFIGGLVGNSATGSGITNGWASGNVTATGPNAGGLVGFNTTSVISNTYATGTVSGTAFVGGLVGSGAGNVNNSYATGSVTGSSTRVGGLVGHIYADITFSNSYATGSVAGSGMVGGFAGSVDAAGAISNGYWDSSVTATGVGSGSSTGVTGRTSTEMKAMSSFTGFSISDGGGSNATWRIYEGNTTPWLRVFLTPIMVTANNDSKTYNGVAYTGGNGISTSIASPNPALSGTPAFSGTSQSAVNVGSYDITPSGLYSVQQGYDISYASGALTINAANLTLSGTRVYDGTTSFAGGNLTAGGVNGETFAVTGTGAAGNLASKNVQTNQALASITGLTLGASGNGGLASNYNALSTAGSSVSVTAAGLTLSGTRVYDGTTIFPGSALTATGVAGETFAVTGAGAAGNLSTKHVQTNQALASVGGLALGASGNGGLAGNYDALSTTGSTVSVTPASITASTSNVMKTYDGGTTASGSPVLTVGTLFGTDALSGGSFAFTDKNVGSGNKTVTVSDVTVSDGNSGNNYSVVHANNTTSTINAATLTYTANTASRYVGESDPAFGGSVTGFVGGETLGTATTGTATFATTATNASPVGNYPINGSGLTANNGNYVFVQALSNATAFTISEMPAPPPPTPLIITAENKSKIYGAELPTFTATFAGFINGHTQANVTGLQFTTTATASSNVGTYTITPFGATAPSDYVVTYVAGLLTINPATLTYVATPATRFFGAPNPPFTGTVTGFVNGDAQASATTGTLIFTSAATTATPAGTYAIDGSGLTANQGNYVFVQAASNATALTIGTQTPLTISADDKTKIYGAALPTFTATFNGFVNGDTAEDVSNLQFSTTATMGSNIGTYTITPFGATAPDYYLVGYMPGTLTISPAALTLTANDAVRSYGAANPVFGASYVGFVNGDTENVVSGLSLATTATTTSGIGAYPITASGATAANYEITVVPGTLTVSPATLTVTASNATKVYGASNPVFAVGYSGFVNGDTAGSVTGLQLDTSATAGSGVGMYAITPGGAAATNYTLRFVPGTLTIQPASLTLTANDAEREFGTANPMFSATLDGLVNGDTASVVSGLVFATPATATSPVGAYAIVPGGATAANYTLTFVNGTLRVAAPSVVVGTTTESVVVVDGQPALSDELAVVSVGERLTLVGLQGELGSSTSIEENLTIILTETSERPRFGQTTTTLDEGGVGTTTSTNTLNFGSFEPVAIGVGDSTGSGGTAIVAQPGLYRESTVSMGGFNVIYHEAVTDAQEQAENNTALGSSYREFSDEENPQVNLVRSKMERKLAEPGGANAGSGT